MKFSLSGRLLWSSLACLVAGSSLAFIAPQRPMLPDLDKRAVSAAPTKEQSSAAGQLKSILPTARVDLDGPFGAPKMISAHDGFLTGPNGMGRAVSPQAIAAFPAGDANRATKAFLTQHSQLFGFGPALLDQARINRDYVTAHNGLHTVVWQQQVDGVEVFEAVFLSHTTAKGELVNVCSQFLPDPVGAADKGVPGRTTLLVAPTLSARDALVLGIANIGEKMNPAAVVPLPATAENAGATAAEQRQEFKAPGLKGPATAKLIWLPIAKDQLRLCWDVVFMSRARGEMFRTLVDVQTSEVLIRRCLTSYLTDATYRVYTSDSPSPFSPGWATPNSGQPALTLRTLVTTPALNTNASPNGWIDDGVNETRGNNVDAHTDHNADDLPDLPRPQGSPFRVFDFAMDLTTQDPLAYTNAAVVQLFYLNNFMHDKLYELGFTEATGNFQNNNFGRGGAGNDAVQADAQDGSGTDNANFSTPPDGASGRMQMYIFTTPTPRRDGDFDAEVVLHEYTHGLSNRRVGGGVLISQFQTAGMGEGWSDFYGLSLLSEAGDDVNGNYAAGGYASYKIGSATDTQNYYFGIRRYPYTTAMSRNPLTFKDIDPAQADYCSSPAPYHTGMFGSCGTGSADEVHNQGEVWCVTLWEARASLITKYGWAVGNHLILQLVTDGMGLSPANPNFLQARDAIIQADQVDTGGANRNELWAAFAKRGMGSSATSPASSTTVGVHESYDIPDDLHIAPQAGFVSSGPVGGPFTVTSQTYALTNVGTNALSWVLANTAPWLDVAPSSGALTPGGPSTPVGVTLSATAGNLPSNIYSATVYFTNTTSGRVQGRDFMLRVGLPDYYTEQFNANDDDLAFSTLTFTPNGSGSYYALCREAATDFPTDPSGSGSNYVALTDDSFAQVTLSGTNKVGLYGRSTNVFFIGSNGYLTLNQGTNTYSETFASHFDLPRISALFHDLNPGAGGAISWKQLTNRVAVTYQNVPQYGTANPNNFQIEWFFDGRIRLTWLTINCLNNIVGLSQGLGVPGGFSETDLSAAGPCVPPVTVQVPASATEGAGVLLGAGRVSIVATQATDLVVTLTSSDTTAVVVPAIVTIVAGQTNATFDLTIIDDALLDGTQNSAITASAPGFGSSSASMAVYDNETANLGVVLPASVTEGQGTAPGLVTVSAPVAAPVSVTLSSSDTTEIQVPATVLIPVGQTSAVFTATVVADSIFDGTKQAIVTAHVQNWTDGTATVNVLDDVRLLVQLPSMATEGDGVLANGGRIQLAASVLADLVVSLYPSNSTEIDLPPTITIPAGQSGANFDIAILHNLAQTGDQVVGVGASAPGFTAGSSTMIVRDYESLPVLTVGDAAVLEGDFGTTTNLVFTVQLSPASATNITAAYTTADGTALAGVDYQARSGVVTFNPGATAQIISVPVIGNNIVQSNHTFLLRLTNSLNAAIGRSQAVGTIVDDDGIPGKIHHFTWGPVASPQEIGLGFSVQILAQDAANHPATNFPGPVSLTASGAVSVTGMILGNPAGSPSSSSFDYTLGYSFTPNTNITVTHVRHYFGTKVSIWSDSGTLLAIQPVVSTPGTWTETPLAAPLRLNANTTYRVGVYTANSTYYYQTSLGTTFPDGTINQAYYILGDGFPSTSSTAHWWYVDLKYTIPTVQTVPIFPTASGNFSASSWTGTLAVLMDSPGLTLVADDGHGHTGISSSFVVLPSPISASGAALLSESCSPANHAIDPGELVTVALGIRNSSASAFSNVVATLVPAGGVYQPSGPVYYGLLEPGGTAISNSFTFRSLAPCGGTLQATLQLQDGTNNLGTVSYTFPVGGQQFSQNFDGVTVPAMPSGWTVTWTGAGAAWATTSASSDSAPNSAFAPDPSSISDNRLTSPGFGVASSTAQLSFRHSYNTESSYDGGVLEISTNGGAFYDILAMGGSFVANGYNQTISTSFQNPLAGRQAWSGNSGGFVTTLVNLPALAAGKTVQLRWRLGSDTSVSSIGWYVDTIALSDGAACCLCSPIIFASQTAAGQPQISVLTLSGHTYYTEYKNDLKDATWLPLQTLTGDGTVQIVIDPTAGGQRFYRVRVQ